MNPIGSEGQAFLKSDWFKDGNIVGRYTVGIAFRLL